MESSQKSIVIVVGMHRSGTSLCSHLLTHLGYDMADEPAPHSSNPKGHWERAEIVSMHNRILRHFDRDYYSPNHAFGLPPSWWMDPDVARIRDELTLWLTKKLRGPALFGFKDPRTCLMFPVWNEILTELDVRPKFVFCVRDPAQVVRSIAERDQLDACDSEFRWVRYNAHAIAGIGERDTAIIPYELVHRSGRQSQTADRASSSVLAA